MSLFQKFIRGEPTQPSQFGSSEEETSRRLSELKQERENLVENMERGRDFSHPADKIRLEQIENQIADLESQSKGN